MGKLVSGKELLHTILFATGMCRHLKLKAFPVSLNLSKLCAEDRYVSFLNEFQVVGVWA
jgi:hypothetical protein